MFEKMCFEKVPARGRSEAPNGSMVELGGFVEDVEDNGSPGVQKGSPRKNKSWHGALSDKLREVVKSGSEGIRKYLTTIAEEVDEHFLAEILEEMGRAIAEAHGLELGDEFFPKLDIPELAEWKDEGANLDLDPNIDAFFFTGECSQCTTKFWCESLRRGPASFKSGFIRCKWSKKNCEPDREMASKIERAQGDAEAFDRLAEAGTQLGLHA